MTIRTHLSVLVGSLTSLAVSAATTSGQTSQRWSGSVRSGSDAWPIEARIPDKPGLRAFEITSHGRVTVHASDVEITGIRVRFHATFDSGAECAIDAVPARGYAGSCALATGDSVRLMLVPPASGMLFPDHEIALALDAAPPSIRRDASVFVLTGVGYTEAVRGTNAFTCFIERPTANDLWPMCMNREASKTLVPVERMRARLRAVGSTDATLADSVAEGYRRGRFRAPASGAMAYMLSRYAWTANVETGAQEFIGPHLHIYAPFSTNARIGVDTTTRPVVAMRVEREGRPDASIIVGVRLIEPASVHQ